jgi:hypothetical protein
MLIHHILIASTLDLILVRMLRSCVSSTIQISPITQITQPQHPTSASPKLAFPTPVLIATPSSQSTRSKLTTGHNARATGSPFLAVNNSSNSPTTNFSHIPYSCSEKFSHLPSMSFSKLRSKGRMMGSCSGEHAQHPGCSFSTISSALTAALWFFSFRAFLIGVAVETPSSGRRYARV